MGNNGSATPAAKTELDEPWRTIVWENTRRNELMDSIKNYKPKKSSVKQSRILLVGPFKAGKSSFFNSIDSVFHGRITARATSGSQGSSVTTEFHTYKVKDSQNGRSLSFLLCDTMGLEPDLNAGLSAKDFENILSGNIPDRYQFTRLPTIPHNFNGSHKPKHIKDRIHCVVYVIDICSLPAMSDQMKRKLTDIRQLVDQRGTPQMVILTKVDEACSIVEKDLTKVYHSIYIKKKVEEVSEFLGVPILNILPVKNYSYETDLDDNCDILMLSALQRMLNYSDDYFDNI